MFLPTKMCRLMVSGVAFTVVLAACGSEVEQQPEVTYEPTPSADFVTVEPLGTVFTHEPDSDLGLESTSEPGS